MFHIHVFACKNLTLQLLEISSPQDSPNTDGIHIGESQKVNVLNSLIRTGDDCVSVGGGNVDITISGINCGPGHGISIGSLGGAAGDNDVTGVSVSNCNLTGTSNGVRIKTWEKPYNLSVSRVVFEGIQMDRVSNPILIDQHYCPQHNCVQKVSSSSPSSSPLSSIAISSWFYPALVTFFFVIIFYCCLSYYYLLSLYFFDKLSSS